MGRRAPNWWLPALLLCLLAPALAAAQTPEFGTSAGPGEGGAGRSIGGGSLGGNIPGYYALDPITGRAIAFVSRNILGGSGTIFYLISATTDHSKVVMMGNGLQTVSSVVANFAY